MVGGGGFEDSRAAIAADVDGSQSKHARSGLRHSRGRWSIFSDADSDGGLSVAGHPTGPCTAAAMEAGTTVASLICMFEQEDFMPATYIRPPPPSQEAPRQPRAADHDREGGATERAPAVVRPRVELIDTSLSGNYYLKRDSRAWKSAFQAVGFEVQLHARQSGAKEMRKTVHGSDVVLCEGLFHRNTACMRSSSYKQRQPHQRVAMIAGMRSILWTKDAMCNTITAVDTLPSMQDGDGKFKYTIPCYVLPHDLPKLTDAMSKHARLKNIVTQLRTAYDGVERTQHRATGAAPGQEQQEQQRYMVKPLNHGEGHGIFVASTIEEILNTKNEYIEGEMRLVQPFVADPFLINGKKFDLRTYVLVTSISPLRAYFYDEGLVRFAAKKYKRNSTKEEEYLTNTSTGKKYVALKNLTWAFKQLRAWFDSNGFSAAAIFDSIHAAVVSLLMASEAAFRNYFRLELGGDMCTGCYQLLGVDVMLDANLNPQVIEVNGLPSMQLADDGDRNATAGVSAAAGSVQPPQQPAQKGAATQLALDSNNRPSSPVTNQAAAAETHRVNRKPRQLRDAPHHHQSANNAGTEQHEHEHADHKVGANGDGVANDVDHNSSYVTTKLSLTADIVALVYKPTSVAADVASALEQLGVGVGPGAFCNEVKHTHCINKAALAHFARGRREFLNRGHFQRIYPSATGAKYAHLASHVHTIGAKAEAAEQARHSQNRNAWARNQFERVNSDLGTTWELHDVSIGLERLWSAQPLLDTERTE